MSKIKLPLRHLNLVLALLTCYFSSNANSNSILGTYSQVQIEQRLDDLHTDVDLKLTPEVKKYLHQYIVSYRKSSEALIGRSLVYFPDIESSLEEKNLPSEIKYLSIIESSLKPSAKSRVGAVGLWQFMKETARMYGLEIDKHVDERRDVEKSTEAALNYLSDLNERFGDWTLALAAYNCGPGNVRKAMRRSGGHDYWSIRNHLPRETRNYLPKFIAVTYLMNYYADHDLAPICPDELFVKTRKVVLTDGASFSDIAKITGVDVEIIQYYNPSYIGEYVPKSTEGKILELPTQAMYTYVEEIQKFDMLIPDPLQDLKEETKVAAQVIEKRETLQQLPQLEKRRILENFELIYTFEDFEVRFLEPVFVLENRQVKRRQFLTFFNVKDRKKQGQKVVADKMKPALILD